MIEKDSFSQLLIHLDFKVDGCIYTKTFNDGVQLIADFEKEELVYPENDGLKIRERHTCKFSSSENAVVFECVHKLLSKGYKAKHIELEPKWKLGHGSSGGRADILVKNQNDLPLVLIECKTYGREFDKAWKETLVDGGQLFSYAHQISETEFLCLYASEFDLKSKELLVEQRIISHKDNEKVLNLGDNLKSYSSAQNLKARFDVWKETYQQEFTESGIFEGNLQAYQIGKNNYTLDMDTRPVTEKDKEGKYHRFRTILRQHNIARRETAFEVLVNLFLAKIVDEEENKNDLEFYWKGMAYDNYFDFIDRLQKLYQIGMRKFLKDEVTYISNEQIDSAFWTVKNKKNATKSQIQKYFRDLKFYSNNAFSLVNVHNERLFNKNTKVLVELVQMWQGLRLKTKEQNQFLGDMFEFFLDNSIKQSEGQFFTPMPITKFIVSALPIEQKIVDSSEPLKAIDYACGSGHFLTEYAHQIEPLVQKHKQLELSSYYENTFGIEKEDRLAKIAKVSAYMYGQDHIKIIEEDALGKIPDVKEESFDILIANPPFSVEGFLLNLSEEQRNHFKLIDTVGQNLNTKFVQCFFIEKAKQLMASDGVIGIIVPIGILTNADGTHIMTREIILKFFDIISIVELGKSTFGKTGQPTIVLFLRRKNKKPEVSEHYKNRVEDYFSSRLNEQVEGGGDIAEYQDLSIIKAYCNHNHLPFDSYIHLFGITHEKSYLLDELFKNNIFKNYKSLFFSSNKFKEITGKKYFKSKSEEEKNKAVNEALFSYIHEIEKDKLYYFMLANDNKQKVLVVRSPSSATEQKEILGYSWSGAKGNEGIQYNDGSSVSEINTIYFNPKDPDDPCKINFLIKQNFSGIIPEDLSMFDKYKGLISYQNVQELLDFTGTAFDKSFSLSSKDAVVADTVIEPSKLRSLTKLMANLPDNQKQELKLSFEKAQSNLTQSIQLNDKKLFSMSIGKRLIAKEIKKNNEGTDIPVYSANVFEPFGYIGSIRPVITA